MDGNLRNLRVANPIYREVIPRQLTYSTQRTIVHEPAWYLTADGQLDMSKLLSAFQEFFREHSEHWVECFQYREAGPQLLLQAFLQRIVNSGGHIYREYGLGRGRTDIPVTWPHAKGVQKAVLELKIQQRRLQTMVDKELRQIVAYLDRCGQKEGHLILFDRTPGKLWKEKIFRRDEVYEGYRIAIWGM